MYCYNCCPLSIIHQVASGQQVQFTTIRHSRILLIKLIRLFDGSVLIGSFGSMLMCDLEDNIGKSI